MGVSKGCFAVGILQWAILNVCHRTRLGERLGVRLDARLSARLNVCQRASLRSFQCAFSKNRCASSAAIQPVPALVTAWR
jgi:hypothetical protein